MRISSISSAYNSLTQRVHSELARIADEVSVELALGDQVMRERVRRYDPDLIIAPMLTTATRRTIWSARPCFIVHPGPRGDRGPSSLDWAIMDGAGALGGSPVLQANGEMGRRGIWASVGVTMPRCSKSSVYRDRSRTRRPTWPGTGPARSPAIEPGRPLSGGVPRRRGNALPPPRARPAPDRSPHARYRRVP